MDAAQEIKSLKKALNALAYMNQEGEATVASLARALGLPRTTAFRLLMTLVSAGYIEKVADSGVYRLTSRVLLLSSGYQEESLMLEAAAPLLRKTGKEIGWPLSITTPRASEMIVRLTTIFDTSMVLNRFAVGYGVPILYTTTGLCFLALCAEPERMAVLELARQANDPREQLVHDIERLDAILSRIRDRGFSVIEYPEYREGNVGVPLTIYGRIVGGIVMRYIKSAMSEQKMRGHYVPLLKQLSRDIQIECETRLNDRTGHRYDAGAVALPELEFREWLDLG